MNPFNVYKDWRKDKEEKAKKAVIGKRFALFAAAGVDIRRAYRCKNKNDIFGVIKSTGAVEMLSYKQYNKHIAQKIKEFEHLGGTITFSSDVTHKWVDGERKEIDGVIDKIVAWIKTYGNRIFVSKQINKAVTDAIPRDIGISLGNFFVGRYIDQDGNVFDEKSISIDIKNVTSEELKNLSHAICKQFDQNSVIVEDKNLNEAYEYIYEKGS